MCSETLSLEAACEALRKGRIVIFPTETFYGIGCNAMDPDAVGAVFSAKKRSLSLPLPVVVYGRDQLDQLVSVVPDAAIPLMEAFWPGPLSIVFPARGEVPDLLTANAGRVAVRCSSHPAVIALCETSGLVLVASSANLSGFPPVTAPEDLDPELVAAAAGVFVAGPVPAGGLPSTVVDILETREGAVVRILRKGAVSEEEIRAAGFQTEDCTLAPDVMC